MAEGVGRDLEAQQPPVGLADLVPPRRDDPADQRRGRLARRRLRAPAERREVVLTDERIAGQPEGPQVERRFDVPRRRREEGIGSGLVQDRVAVAAPERPRSGRRSRARPPPPRAPRSRAAEPVDAALQPGQVQPVGRRVEGDDLAPRVHAGVRAAGRGEHDLVAEDAGDGAAERAGDRRHVAVQGEAVERRPVVGDDEPHPHGRSIEQGHVDRSVRAARPRSHPVRPAPPAHGCGARRIAERSE